MGAIHTGFGTTTECFASPLNVHLDTTHYCSKYPEDKVFGSLGSTYDIRPTGSFEFNSEYTPIELQKAIKWVATAAKLETSPVLGVGIFPDWSTQQNKKRWSTFSKTTQGTQPWCTYRQKPNSRSQLPTTGLDNNQSSTPETAHTGESTSAAGWRKYYDPELLETALGEACTSTLNSELYVAGRGGMAKEGQVTLYPTPWDSYSTVDYLDESAWYESIERDKENIFTTHTGYLEGRQIPAHTPSHPPDTPASWYQPMSAKHVSAYGIYTDGSLQTSKDGNVNCGSGIYLSETGEGHSYTFDGHQTVLMAELVAIIKAVSHKASPGEVERTSFTDSLNSLHDLHKMIHSPRKMRTHRHRVILSYILKKAAEKRDANNQLMQVHMYKVKAHVNISGNEEADAYAKAPYLLGNSQVEHVQTVQTPNH